MILKMSGKSSASRFDLEVLVNIYFCSSEAKFSINILKQSHPMNMEPETFVSSSDLK